MANENNKSQGTGAKSPGKSTMSAKDIAAAKRQKALEEKNEKLVSEANELTEKIIQLEAKAAEVPTVEPAAAASPESLELSDLKAQVRLLSDQVLTHQSSQGAGKPKYKPVPSDDFQEEGVTFSCRQVYFVIGSYLDHRGMEIMPPYKLIKFHYAASDIRQDGREQNIVNSCTFTTHLKAEIGFLKDHPLNNVKFFENMNEAMSSDAIYSEFRVKAANQVIGMTDEAVLKNAHEKGVKGVDKKGLPVLRRELSTILSNDYIREAKSLQDDQSRKRLLLSQASN